MYLLWIRKQHRKSLCKIFFVDTDKNILKYLWKGKGTVIAKTNFKKKTKVGRTNLSNFKTSNIPTVN
jgi:hypothetical protein